MSHTSKNKFDQVTRSTHFMQAKLTLGKVIRCKSKRLQRQPEGWKGIKRTHRYRILYNPSNNRNLIEEHLDRRPKATGRKNSNAIVQPQKTEIVKFRAYDKDKKETNPNRAMQLYISKIIPTTGHRTNMKKSPRRKQTEPCRRKNTLK